MGQPTNVVTADEDLLIFSSFQSELETLSVLGDPYMGLSGQLNPKGKATPGIVTIVNLADRVASNTRTMVMPPRNAAKMGDNHRAEDFGETLELKAFRSYANSWDKVIDRGDPNTKLSASLSGRAFFMYCGEALKTFSPLQRGDYFRRSAVESYSPNLTTAADGGPGLTSRYNMNILINNCPLASQPAYNATAAAYLANIIAGCAAASTTDTDYATMESFHRLAFQLSFTWKIKGIGGEYGGKKIIFIGPRTSVYLKSLSTAGSVAFLQKSTLSEKIASMAWSDENLGELPGGIVCVVDPRAPLLVYDSQAGSIQIVYAGVDNESDPRNAFTSGGNIKVFEINVVAGQSYFTNTQKSKPLFRDQVKDFERISQVAVLAIEGMNITEFDENLASNRNSTSRWGQGGGLFLTYVPGLF